MSFYTSGSYGKTASGFDIRGPKALSRKSRGSKAIGVGELTLTEAPDYVLINTSGSYHFAYDATGSYGTSLVAHKDAHPFIKAVEIPLNAGSGYPLRIDISPNAWSGSTLGGTTSFPTGSVTFVYGSNT
tara:strand:- start:279 stop:665 length:387 start_codon:yes stop_codon:yes gene_type:complete